MNEIHIKNQHIFFQTSEDMRSLSSESIDLIITSPPYNRNKNYVSSIKEEKYNDHQTLDEYYNMLKRVWQECYRVAKKNCVFFLNIGDSATDQGKSEQVKQLAIDVGWILVQDIIWVKSLYGRGHYTPTGNNKRLNNIWEHVYMLVKDSSAYHLKPKAIGIPYVDKSNIGRYSDIDLRDAGNVWHLPYEKTTGSSIKKGHDAPFPLGLPYYCIQLVENVQTILDPFVGSGTTLAVANQLGLQGFGYELYPQVDLITETILNSKYEYQVPILIPHYEQAIRTLSRLFDQYATYLPLPVSTKKEQEELSNLKDTLHKLKIKSLRL